MKGLNRLERVMIVSVTSAALYENKHTFYSRRINVRITRKSSYARFRKGKYAASLASNDAKFSREGTRKVTPAVGGRIIFSVIEMLIAN